VVIIIEADDQLNREASSVSL